MKIAIAYPPLETKKGVPQISQNRQFQFTAAGWLSYFIYPVIPAYAATMLKQAGHEVVWLDGLAEKWSQQEWLAQIEKEKPDLLMMETKTPVIKQHWQIIEKLKVKSACSKQVLCRGAKLKVVLVGDHVTALPEESFRNSLVDYVLTGGDYDFLLLNLVNHLTKKEKLKQGIYYREGNKIKNTGRFLLNHDLDTLPLIDRNLTKWRLYAYKNSNFYRGPGAYTMFGRDCWWGKCIFCSWAAVYPFQNYRTVSVSHALKEVGNLIKKYEVKEIMDDSGTFPVGQWLREFCQGMIQRQYYQRVKINCNLRFEAGLKEKDYQLMGKAGFRFLLYGLESGSPATLTKINKGLRLDRVEKVLTWAKRAGLMPHLTVMVGYPWETEEDIQKTVSLTKRLSQKGLIDSLQATLLIPYPGTLLFESALENGWLKTKDWNRYDMTEPILKTKVRGEKLSAAIRSLYSHSIWTPRFILNTVFQLKSIDGLKYVSFQALKYFGKLWEFK